MNWIDDDGAHRDARPRLLVAIASYGSRNLALLKQSIDAYRRMAAFDVHVVVLSDAPKDVGRDVEVIVGLPSRNPWSLPFAHQPVFAARADQHDLFIYSEDDIGVTALNIQAFLRASDSLPSAEIAGFLRYETAVSGTVSMPDMHGGHRWKPETVQRRGAYVVAEFTNEHAAFYVLTRAQLKHMIAADGFAKAPHEGRYDMLCTAATDPYTAYGLRKVICVSHIDDFLVHHRSNRYAGTLGIPRSTLDEQVATLIEIADGRRPAATLFGAASHWSHGAWTKNFYERPDPELLSMVPPGAQTALSIGCGWGATEKQLLASKRKVTVVPIDSVFGAMAERQGLDVATGTLNDCFGGMEGRSFDCVLISDLLHLVPDPSALLERCCQHLSQGGTLLLTGPNLGSLKVSAKRLLNLAGCAAPRTFEEGGISIVGPGRLKRALAQAGLRVSAVRWSKRSPGAGRERWLGRLCAQRWTLQAVRPGSTAVRSRVRERSGADDALTGAPRF